MSNNAYQNAVSKRDALKKELEKIEEFLTIYQQFDSNVTTPDISSKPSDSLQKIEETQPAAQRRKSLMKASPIVLKDVAKAALREAGIALSRRQLIEAIEAKGYLFPGANKSNYMGSLIHRYKDEISRSENGGYWFTGHEVGKMPESKKNN